MWEQFTDEEIDAETIAAAARIDAAQHTIQSLTRERTRRAMANQPIGGRVVVEKREDCGNIFEHAADHPEGGA